eukprot:COSAG02_NODE_71175_length_192_cov_25.397849_1_plen_31_part_01
MLVFLSSAKITTQVAEMCTTVSPSRYRPRKM